MKHYRKTQKTNMLHVQETVTRFSLVVHPVIPRIGGRRITEFRVSLGHKEFKAGPVSQRRNKEQTNLIIKHILNKYLIIYLTVNILSKF